MSQFPGDRSAKDCEMIGQRTLSGLAGLCCLFASGCLYPYGYHSGMYQQPIPAQQGAFPQTGSQVTFLDNGQGTAADAGLVPPDPTAAQPGISRDPVSAPEVRGATSGEDNPVPEPRDPGASADGSPSGVRTSEGVLDTGNDLTLVNPNEPVFLKPVVMNEDGTGQTVVPAHGTTPLIARQPASDLGRDANYRWLQGDLQYDVQNRSWHLIYDYTPP
ncbi:MAG: hypothetical protein H8E37_08170, partial [Planctomycetes bacterium]|nr:hypothetical protein [Planctomycetota bacterium]